MFMVLLKLNMLVFVYIDRICIYVVDPVSADS